MNTQGKARNFCFHIPGPQKEQLKILAEKSGMTLTEYIEVVIAEAQRNGDIFEIKIQKRQK